MSTKSSEARFHEAIRIVEVVYITGYISNDPELQKNCCFVLKGKDSFEKWKLSVAKYPKAEVTVKILTHNPKERLENQKKIDLSSMMVINTTKARIKALMAQFIKEYTINNKYSKLSSVYINTANPKECIHITYEMGKDDFGGSSNCNNQQASFV
ncbi:hypothetical protein BY996DRAFT_6411155 [Phakopsora pachyrhizi]|nr:hypothetical protein BY996DRAFT_6411155 [Phakopsora pachyrhizi]